MKFDELPLDVKRLILRYMTYDETARLRQVSKEFNVIGQQHLNAGFKQVTKRHSALVHRIKSILPRRESERRNHALSRHNEILTAVETRISLLNMTIMKHVTANQCCFIAGKVLDEFNTVFDQIECSINSSRPIARSHEILTELRDISSMAMEHFDEHIVPLLKKKLLTESSKLKRNIDISSLTEVKSFSENYFDHHEHLVRWSTTVAALRAKVNSFTSICQQNKVQVKLQREQIRRLESTVRQQQDQINTLLEKLNSKQLESSLGKRSCTESDKGPQKKRWKIA
ncbi:DgyrCDS8484 [Dimorphilus gyrociliatus]|uniref:DgyrCDS8484 n=1 Tax=Dimorphilus gyrociliatus TaxID=2664684 RepID=A0A7I8VZF7_9ANNE|nr:DgyrCDS8484 [Dimorphilus gyrociliatus]